MKARAREDPACQRGPLADIRAAINHHGRHEPQVHQITQGLPHGIEAVLGPAGPPDTKPESQEEALRQAARHQHIIYQGIKHHYDMLGNMRTTLTLDPDVAALLKKAVAR